MENNNAMHHDQARDNALVGASGGDRSTVKHKGSTARDVFFSLLIIVALYISVISFLSLIFQLINHWLPETVAALAGPNMTDEVASIILAALSALIVAWPVFIVINYLSGREFKKEPARRNTAIRRWLTYLTLFIASVVIIVTLIILVNSLLRGEFSARVILKLVSTIIVAGGLLGYYAWELKNKPAKKFGPRVVSGSLVSLLVLIVVILGFVVFGGPSTQRDKGLDRARANDIQLLQSQIDGYYFEQGSLPKDLSGLSAIGVSSMPKDPQTGESYEYKVTGKDSYQLCANFVTDNTADASASALTKQIPPYEFTIDGNLVHVTGRVCFDENVNIGQNLPPVGPVIKR